MARRKTRIDNGPDLYHEQERRLIRRMRRQRALFIPRFLRDAAMQLKDPQQDAAYQIALRWAELETRGHLAGHKETSIDTQFLDQLFGQGLGYQVKTASPEAWHLEHKLTVPGVGTADGALGNFPSEVVPTVIIELKDANTDLDRDRFNGRTPVQQCWDYLNALPDCPWGIVSNFLLIRLYHREKGTLSYEEFTLQELRDRERFNQFYYVFHRHGLLPSRMRKEPLALALLRQTIERQKEVGDDLYNSYHWQRLRLIEHLMKHLGKPLDGAIRVAQKILDRIIFIAFCEDRELLTEHCLKRAAIPPMDDFGVSRENPRWRKLLGLFNEVDRGGRLIGVEQGYNGNLFKPDPEIDQLELDDDDWIPGLTGFGEYDFSDEVNVEVLGHLFERSVTELEKLRLGGLFALKASVEAIMGVNGSAPTKVPSRGRKRAPQPAALPKESPLSRMPKSAQRKRFGIYYTPPAFTGPLVERTVETIIAERLSPLRTKHGVDPESREQQDPKKLRAYWLDCLEALKSVTVCDPACGSGAFLIAAYDALDAHYKTVVHGLAGAGLPAEDVTNLEESIPDLILDNNIYGVDLSHEAVEITQLALWIRSARRNKTLADLSRHIVSGNSLVDDSSIDPKALNWQKTFPKIFGKGRPGGFSCVIGNPPWERVKVQEREFFSLTDPETAEAVNAADRRKRLVQMPKKNPGLYAAYEEAQAKAQATLEYARKSGRYPLTGKADVNTYMLFAELSRSIVSTSGVVGLLVPSGIATDDTTKEFFQTLMDDQSLVLLYDFENKKPYFEDVHRSFKFSALVFGGSERKTKQADFLFFAREMEEIVEPKRHIPLTAADMKLFNPNTRTCPIFRTRRDADLTKAIYKRIPILIDENRKSGGNPWGIKFFTMFHQTNDAEHFQPAQYWKAKKYSLEGNVFVRSKKRALPLYEAKMVQAFDHRAASVIVEDENWVRQGQKEETSLVQHQNPEYAVTPRWWVDEVAVEQTLESQPGTKSWFMGFKDITSPTNERTMIASFIPRAAVTNKFVLMLSESAPRTSCCLLANFNSFAFDYVTRQKIGGITLNFFIVEQLPTLPADRYWEKCPWSKRETLEHWISERVLRLSCTAEDMMPLAKACGFEGSRGDGVHIWKDAERATLRAELDAAFFHLYGITRDDVEYILSTFTNTGLAPADDRPSQQYLWNPGSTGEIVLDAFDRLKPA